MTAEPHEVACFRRVVGIGSATVTSRHRRILLDEVERCPQLRRVKGADREAAGLEVDDLDDHAESARVATRASQMGVGSPSQEPRREPITTAA